MPDVPVAATPELAEFQVCEQQKQSLAATVIQLNGQLGALQKAAPPEDKTDSAATEQALQECREDEAQSKRTNIDLNEKKIALEADLKRLETETKPEDPQVAADLDEARAALAAAEARSQGLEEELATAQNEIAELTERLKQFGLAAKPSFYYLGNSAYNSSIRLTDLKSSVPLNDRIPASDCDPAFKWLESQTVDKPLFGELWVWDGDTAMLCSVDDSGAVKIVTPRAVDEAHVLLFR